MCGLHFGTEIAPVELMNTAIEGKAKTYETAADHWQSFQNPFRFTR